MWSYRSWHALPELDGVMTPAQRAGLRDAGWDRVRRTRLFWLLLVGYVLIFNVAALVLVFYESQLGRNGWIVLLVLWMSTALLIVPLGLVFRARHRRWVAAECVRRGKRPRRCLVCGYDLRGTPGNACPECGTELAPPADEVEADR